MDGFQEEEEWDCGCSWGMCVVFSLFESQMERGFGFQPVGMSGRGNLWGGDVIVNKVKCGKDVDLPFFLCDLFVGDCET